MKINHKSKGFTLMELIVVIVILALLILMAGPQILRLLESGQENTFRDDVLEIFKVSETAYTEKSIKNDGSIKVEGNNKKFCATLAKLKEDGYLNKELNDAEGNPVWQGWVEVSVPINGSSNATYTITITNNQFYLVNVNRSEVQDATLNDDGNTKEKFDATTIPSYCLTATGDNYKKS